MRDGYGRDIDYMRISVTDRCDLRCRYCMPPEGVRSVSHDEILRFDEILRLTRLFAEAGIKKIKITGGEPTVRRGVIDLIGEIRGLPGIEEVTMTTNGLRMGREPEMAHHLAEAGVSGINLSLDTLREDRYRQITGTDGLHDVLRAVDSCCAEPELRVKINTVTMADWNGDEIEALAGLARDRRIDVRFIEMMPMGMGRDFRGYSQDQIMARLEAAYGPAAGYEGPGRGSGPAVYYDFEGFMGKVGFISALSHRFCESCNRLRLTPEGFLKPCLQYAEGVDLRSLLRGGADDETLAEEIRRGIFEKPRQHGFCGEGTDPRDPEKSGEPAEADLRKKDERLMSGIGG